MKLAIVLLICVLKVFTASAQTSAITSDGDEVLLYQDGTWKYANENENSSIGKEIPTNKAAFTKSKTSTFEVKSKITEGVSIFINPKEWTFKKGEENGDAEYQFESKSMDAYGMLISERIEITLDGLKQIALENAKKVAPDIASSNEEYRMVNGKKVFCMQMNGTYLGIKFSYLGYYFSSESGCIQLVTYTSQKLLEEYRGKMEELLNGLTIQ